MTEIHYRFYHRRLEQCLHHDTVRFGFLAQFVDLFRCCVGRVNVKMDANLLKTNRDIFRNAQRAPQIQIMTSIRRVVMLTLGAAVEWRKAYAYLRG